MKMMVLAPAVFPSREIAMKHLKIFLKSCDRWGVDPHLYGIGTKEFPGYAGLKVNVPLAYLKENRADYTHVLYTDSWDVFITGPYAEILRKYKAMGSPTMLASASKGLGNVSDPNRYTCFDPTPPYPYPCVGGYIAEMPYIIEMLGRMEKQFPTYGDDCFMWYDGYEQGWFRPVMDSYAEIFQVREEESLQVEWGDRVLNTVTGTRPCILHLSGGYADQVEGKIDTIRPFAERLGLL